jgi:nicotinamide-nucleotide amidase
VSLAAPLLLKAEQVLALCRSHDLMIATAESCTGGLVAASLTAIAGSSRVFDRGFVSYANEAKIAMLGVEASLIDSQGAVSEAVARAMAEGAISQSRAQAALAITGIAGPDGGSVAKPVGCVHIAAAQQGFDTLHERHLFAGDRAAVREQAALAAMDLLIQRIGGIRP